MAQFKAFQSDVEVNGETVLSFVNGMGGFKDMFLKALQQNGIVDPKEGLWYLQQHWLDAFKEISEKTGPATLKLVGKNIPASAKWPPQVKEIETALASIDVAYHMNHRGGEIGHYRYEKINDNSARLTCNNPYPCDFDLGLIEAGAKKFAHPGQNPVVTHEKGKGCRKNGSESCTYIITW